MSQYDPPLSFASRDDFLARGMVATTLEEPLDCAICRDPLTIHDSTPLRLHRVESTCRSRPSIHQANDSESRYSTTSTQTDNIDPFEIPTTPTTIDTTVSSLETPVQILPCGHIFGSTCLATWFRTTTANRCPLCNYTLFPARTIHLGLREPTHAMRCAFANYVEYDLDDPEYAEEIRAHIMGDWPRMLMREMMVETLRARGFEVTWEYVERDGEWRLLGDEEEAEEEGGLFGEEDEVLSGEEKESENGDKDEEMDTHGEE